MIIGIGTDLVKIDRIAVSIERWGERFVHKILAPAEILAYQKNPSAAFVAKRFAAKEAVAKALATGMSCGVHFAQIAVVGKPGYAPQISLTGAAAVRAETLGVRQMHLSISDEAEFALAFVVLSG